MDDAVEAAIRQMFRVALAAGMEYNALMQLIQSVAGDSVAAQKLLASAEQ